MKARIQKILKACSVFIKYFRYSLVCKLKRIDNSNIWLISERGVDARDNGFHLYEYIKKFHPELEIKFVISKNSPDFEKIADGDVVLYGSKEHYILFKTAGALISTHIMGYSPDMSLFWRMDKKGLLKLKGKKVFLQHGVTCSYQPSFNKRFTKLDLFIVSSEKEGDSIKNNNGYGDTVIKCTGFCRYDTLIDKSSNSKKIILIMPTFRKWLNYVDDFRSTDYFKNWNGLLNNDDFLKFIEANDIKVLFYPHFEIQKYIKEFKSKSKNVVICSFDKYDVQDLLKIANVLITDYSSVQFDFAYMEKKILYYQFDEKKFYREHYKKGYFDFRKMGFGKVCTGESDLIKNLRDFKTDKIFIKRKDTFFGHYDRNNSKRVFDEIRKIVKEGVDV